MPASPHRRSILHLKRADPVLAALIARIGPCRLTPGTETYFETLVRSIVNQQLSGKAAATIHARVVSLLGGRVDPAALLDVPEPALRAAGLSHQKIGYVRDLAACVRNGTVALDDLQDSTDEEIITRLTQVKGIGRWTVQMFLMFRLGRPDVLPDLDLGIQNAIQRAYRLRKRPTPERVRQIGAKWSPHATVASWYLWRSLE